MNITFEKYHGLGNGYLVYGYSKNEAVLSKEHIRDSKVANSQFLNKI